MTLGCAHAESDSKALGELVHPAPHSMDANDLEVGPDTHKLQTGSLLLGWGTRGEGGKEGKHGVRSCGKAEHRDKNNLVFLRRKYPAKYPV